MTFLYIVFFPQMIDKEIYCNSVMETAFLYVCIAAQDVHGLRDQFSSKKYGALFGQSRRQIIFYR